MALKLSKRQMAERDALVIELRRQALALNVAITVYNQAIEPLRKPLNQALDGYNEVLEKARRLANSIALASQGEFDAKSHRWQEGEKGNQVRGWIEQWEMTWDDVDLEIAEPLTEFDANEHADEIERVPPRPTDE